MKQPTGNSGRGSDEIAVDDSELASDDLFADAPAPGHPTPWQS